MNNNHISQFSQFLLARARQQASWDGKHTTVIAAPHYPVYRGKRVLTVKLYCGRRERGLQTLLGSREVVLLNMSPEL